MSFHLSSSLSTIDVRAEFESCGFAQVAGVFPTENAQRIHKCLLEKTPWNLVFTNRGQHVDFPGSQLNSMPQNSVRELQQAIYAEARDNFQYCYNNYPIHDARKAGQNPDHLLHSFHDWLNGDEFLQFARGATGFADISFVDAQATRYMPGHFLTTHDDSHERKSRRAAYIFNFTPAWQPDWGGYLQLLDASDNARVGLRPTFNALNILAVPQRHNVSLVAPFAGGMRLSISGWFRFGEPE